MRKPLLNITIFSDKRKEVLLLLLEENKTLEEIRNALDESSPSILPQIKILKEYKLVCQTKKGYQLTDIGKLIASELEVLNDTCEAMQKHHEYLKKHDHESIPLHLLERLGELKNVNIRTPELIESFTPYPVAIEELKKSKMIKTLVTVYHPDYPPIYADLLEKGIKIEMIFGKNSFEKIRTEYPNLPFLFMGLDNSDVSIYEEEKGPAVLICTDRFFLFSLLTEKGTYDLTFLYSNDKNAIKWGNDLFQYYLEKATPL